MFWRALPSYQAANLPTHCHNRVHPETNLGVVLEAAGGLAGGEVPEAEGLVPRAGEGEVAVGGENHVGHEVGVAVQSLLGHSVLAVLAGQLPHDQGLVTAAGQDHVRVLRVGGDLGHPPAAQTSTSTFLLLSLLTRCDPAGFRGVEESQSCCAAATPTFFCNVQTLVLLSPHLNTQL